jgi:hypothetical protein
MYAQTPTDVYVAAAAAFVNEPDPTPTSYYWTITVRNYLTAPGFFVYGDNVPPADEHSIFYNYSVYYSGNVFTHNLFPGFAWGAQRGFVFVPESTPLVHQYYQVDYVIHCDKRGSEFPALAASAMFGGYIYNVNGGYKTDWNYTGIVQTNRIGVLDSAIIEMN